MERTRERERALTLTLSRNREREWKHSLSPVIGGEGGVRGLLRSRS